MRYIRNRSKLLSNQYILGGGKSIDPESLAKSPSIGSVGSGNSYQQPTPPISSDDECNSTASPTASSIDSEDIKQMNVDIPRGMHDSTRVGLCVFLFAFLLFNPFNMAAFQQSSITQEAGSPHVGRLLQSVRLSNCYLYIRLGFN